MFFFNKWYKICLGVFLFFSNCEIGGIFVRCCLIKLMVFLLVFGIIWIIKLLAVFIDLFVFINIFKLIVEGICLEIVIKYVKFLLILLEIIGVCLEKVFFNFKFLMIVKIFLLLIVLCILILFVVFNFKLICGFLM